jgi:16S rRNA (guanine527-N7)-methyltransferase
VTSREFSDRLVRRARKADVTVSPDLLEPLEAYYRLLARWNERINLTSLPLRAPTDATFDRLFVEPLAASRFVSDAKINWFDLGSGGGSPALPLKLVRPAAALTMVEAKTRKASFLREAVRVLALTGADVQNVRFESLAEWPQLIHSVDVVTVRAVKPDAALMNTAAKLLVARGRLLLFADPLTAACDARALFSCEQTTKLGLDNSAQLSVLVRVS